MILTPWALHQHDCPHLLLIQCYICSITAPHVNRQCVPIQLALLSPPAVITTAGVRRQAEGAYPKQTHTQEHAVSGLTVLMVESRLRTGCKEL